MLLDFGLDPIGFFLGNLTRDSGSKSRPQHRNRPLAAVSLFNAGDGYEL